MPETHAGTLEGNNESTSPSAVVALEEGVYKDIVEYEDRDKDLNIYKMLEDISMYKSDDEINTDYFVFECFLW